MSYRTSGNRGKLAPLIMALSLGMATAIAHAQNTSEPKVMTSAAAASETLSVRQQAIVPIAAFAAAGDITRLGAALNQGLDTGITVSDAKEVLVQVYAYAGFPRSLTDRVDAESARRAREALARHWLPHQGADVCAGAET